MSETEHQWKKKRGDGLAESNPQNAEIWVGQKLDTTGAKYGYTESNGKYWMLIEKMAPQGYSKIWAFVNNAEEMKDMQEITVDKITRVVCGKKRKGDGGYYTFCNVNIDARGTDKCLEQRTDGFNAFQEAIVGKENLPFG